MSVEDEVKSLLADELGKDESEISSGSFIIDDLGVNSIGVVELVMRFEERFEIEISDKDLAKINTVQDVIKYIENHT